MSYQEFIQSIKESHPNEWFEHSERHHIIPRCLGGTDDEDNLIYLTYREHFIAHKLLTEETPEDSKLFYAYWRMANTHINECTPEDYEKARLKLSDLMKCNNPNKFGHIISEETKIKISKAMKGRKYSEETLRRMSESNRGKKRTEETKQHISESHKGENHHMYGKHLPEETKERISASHKGIPLSESHKLSLSEHHADFRKEKILSTVSLIQRNLVRRCLNLKEVRRELLILRENTI